MKWFRQEPPPPPPPPPKPSTLATVLQIGVPVIFLVLVGLLGIVYNGLAEEVKSKASKETLKQMIITQQKLIESNEEDLNEQQEAIKKQQEAINKTLQTIIQMQTEQKYMRQSTIPPRSDYNTTTETVEKPPLSPKEFKEYLKMTPEEKEAFRKLHPAYKSLPK